MVNEWVKVDLFGANNDGQKIRYSISDGVACSKGTLLALIDERIASNSLINSTVWAGVAAEEHCAGKGVTSISVWTQGIFEVVASGGIALGFPVTGTTLNQVLQTSYASAAMVIGRVLGVATQDESINVRLDL